MHNSLISIKPNYAEAIFSGDKTIELRRRIPPVEIGSKLWVYSTRPMGAVIGTVILENIISQSPNELWAQYNECMSINRKLYDKYFEGSHVALGLVLSTPIRCKPMSLELLRETFGSFHPPQVMAKLCNEKFDFFLKYSLVA